MMCHARGNNVRSTVDGDVMAPLYEPGPKLLGERFEPAICSRNATCPE